MFLIILTALTAVCGAAKLDTNYLPPISAKTAGGSPGALLAPLDGSNQGVGGLPTGSYTNDVQGVIVDAANPGSRTSGAEPTGLGGPRASYGSTDSKVGEAAFTGSGSSGIKTRIAPGFGSFVDTDDSQTDKKNGNTLKFTSDVGLENYSYGYETDNGISVGENGVASGGVKAQGGYSYKGDDGKTYSVKYTADKDGYKPQGQHLPTPHPIPEEILKSLEKNAKEEAAGHVDDGSYDAQKYNDEGDYSSADSNNGKPILGGGATSASSAYASQSSQATRPTSGVLIGSYKPDPALGHFTQGGVVHGFGQASGNKDQSEVSGHSSSFKGQFGSSDLKGSNAFGSYGSGGSKKVQTEFAPDFTEKRFGIKANEGHQGSYQFLGSGAGSQVKTPGFNNLPNSAFSSAVATGSGSASAFASSGPIGSGLKNEFNAPFNSFESAIQQAHGSHSGFYSSTGESSPAPSTATASASVSGSQTQQYSGSKNAFPSFESQLSGNIPSGHEHGQAPSSASASASVSGSQNEQLNGFKTESNLNPFPNRFGEGQLAGNSASSGKYESTDKVNLHSKPHGFDSSSAAYTANSQPLNSQASASVPASSTFGASAHQSGFESQNSKIAQNAGQIQLGSTNNQLSGVKPTKPTFGFETNPGSTKVDTVSTGSSQTSAFNSFGSNNIPVSSAEASVSSQTGSIDATFATSTQQSAISQQQGFDDSYYYKQPSKPFVIPISNNRQPNFPATSSLQGSKYPNTQTSSTTGQYQGTSSLPNSGITQAAVSSFASGTSSSSPQFASQSSQLDSKPASSSSFGQSLSSQQTSTQFGATGTQINQKPIVQSQTQFAQSSTSQAADSSQSPTQQYQGTIYQYNKPEVTLTTQGNKDSSSTFGQVKPSQVSTDNRFGTQQSSSQFGSQSSFEQTQTNVGSNVVSSQIGQKPIVSSQVSESNYQQTQFDQKPQTIQSSFISTTNTQNQQFTKPQTSVGSGNAFSQSQNQFSNKPYTTTQTGSSFQQSQFGLASSQFGQKPQTQGSSFTSTTNTQNQQSQYTKPQTTVGSSVTGNAFSQSQTQFGKKPSQNSQTGSSFQQSQFGLASSQFGQKPQTQGSSFTSTTNTQNQQSQYTKPQTTVGSSVTGNAFSQSQNQFSNKPSGTTFEQKPFGTSQTGSSYQQSQFGLTSSQFGQKTETQGSSFTSTTNTQNQQSSFKKPQTTVGSSTTANTFSQSQYQFGKKPSGTTFGQKPFGTSQTGSSYQQSQFGLASSQFGQKPQTQGPTFTSTTNTQYQQSSFTTPQTTVGSSTTANAFSQSQNQFDKKPSGTTFGQKPFGTTQTQFGLGSSQFGQKKQTQSSSFTSTNTNTQNQQSSFTKPQTTAGSSVSSNAFSQSQYQFGKKPSETTFGQKPVSTSQTGSSYQQSQFGLASSQFGQKPQTQGSSFTSNTFSQGNTFQYEKKPVITTQTGSTSQQNEFGSSVSQFGQNSQTVQGSSFGSTTVKPSFGQKPFGSSFQQNQLGSTVPQYGQNSQFTQGSTSINSQTSFGKKPISQQTQFGSGSSQFTQTQSTQFGNKPISTTQTGSAFQQTQSGSVNSKFGQKPLNAQFASTQFGQNSQTSQSNVASTASQTTFGSKPVNQQNQFGSVSSQFSQTSQNDKKPTQVFQQTQFGDGTDFQHSSQSAQGFGVSSTTAKPAFSQKPFGSSYQQPQQSQFESSGNGPSISSQFGQKPLTTQFGSTSQSTQGSSFTTTIPQTSFGIKPVNQQTQFGSAGSQLSQTFQTSQSSKKPTGLSGATSQSSSISQQSTTQFGQTPQTGFNSNTFSQGQTNQFVNKPTQTGSIYQQSQLAGSQFSQKPQTSPGSISTFGQSSFGQKPSNTVQTGSFYQQSQTSSNSYQTSQKPQTASQGFSYTTNTGSKGQDVQGSQSGLTGFGQNTGSVSQNTQYSSSQYEQKPQLSAGIISQNQFGQTSQLGNKLSGPASSSGSGFQNQFSSSSGSQFGQTSQENSQSQFVQTTQYGVKPVGSSQISQGSAQFASTPSRFGQTSKSPQVNAPTLTTISQNIKPQSLPIGYRPQNSGSSFLSDSKKPYVTSTTPAPVRFGSTAAHFGQKPQAQASAFASSSNSNVASFGNTQTGQVSKFQQTSQFGVQNQAVSTTQKPVVSSLSQTNYQQSQYTQTSDKFSTQPQFGQGLSNVGQISGQTAFGAVSQKPYGSTQSTQTTFQQSQFNQQQKPLAGSAFSTGQSVGTQSTQSNVQSSSVTSQGSQSSSGGAQSGNGFNYLQPQSVFTSQFGSHDVQVQKGQQAPSNFNLIVSTTQKPINNEPLNSFGISSTQGSFQETQSSTQFGGQSTKPAVSGSVIQTTLNNLNGQPFKPASTASTQDSNFQSQSSAVSTSQFGIQPTKPTGLAHFSGQPFQSASAQSSGFESQSVIGSTPEYTIQPAQGVFIGTQKPIVSSSAQASFPSRVGSNLNGQAESLAVSTVQTPVPVPGFEIVSNQGFEGQLEEFGGPRDPPRFDDKTGYHY